ncbi:MAG: hypothetical protein MUF12_08500 [Sediminibacterium sp.]|jgi:hypothetical protein|nr:hypothetical protein [Sediminibacterium sp.]
MLTKEQITEIEEMASLYFTDAEIMSIVGIEEIDQTFKNSVKRGRLLREAKVRKSIFNLAESGSGPAQAMAIKIMQTGKR